MFGLSVQSVSGHINVDHSWSNLTLEHKVINAIPSNGNTSLPFYRFPSVVRTERPPNVFVRFESGKRYFITKYLLVGGPSDWQGFVLYTGEYRAGKNFPHFYPIAYPSVVISYIVGTIPARTGEQYGLEIYNGAGDLVMTSGKNLLSLKGQSEDFRSEGRLAHNWLWYSVPKPNNAFIMMQGVGDISRTRKLDITLGIGHAKSDSRLWMMVATGHSGGPWYGYNPFLIVYAEDS